MKYSTFPVTAYEQNCSIVWCEQTQQSAFIDPGGDIDRLVLETIELGVEPVAIYLTHGHLDHVGGAQALARHYAIPVIGPHRDDKYWLDALDQQAEMFSFPECSSFEPDRWLDEGDQLAFGQQRLDVLHAPGHTPGHVVLLHREDGVLFAGDVLFRGSIGRSDFPGGDHQQLINSIKSKLFTLDDAVVVVPGHGPETTIGEERASNPFVR